MSLSKFETESGIQFIYDNVNNQLFEADGTVPITPGMLPTQSEAQFAADTYGKTTKSNKPTAIRLLMGHGCNFDCAYCLQKDIGDPSERPSQKTSLDRLFNAVRDHIDTSALQRLELWGGEPFLYWKDMMALMEFFDREDMTFGITTNGSALSPKHAEFFSKLKGQVLLTISHDAKMQKSLRGEDPLERPRVIETLKMLDGMDHVSYGWLCSITNTNFNLFEINDFFRNKILEHGLKTNSLSFSLGRTYLEKLEFMPSDSLGCQVITIFDKNTKKVIPTSDSFTHVIHGENLEVFRGILAEFLEQHYLQMVNSYNENGYPTIFSKPVEETPLLMTDIYEGIIPYSVTEYARKVLTGEPILETTNCGADMTDVLSVDISGNIRTCPHAGPEHTVGHLNKISEANIDALDLNRTSAHCAPCPNKKLCKSSCPIKFPDEVFLTNCRVEKVWYGEIQKAAFRLIFNEPVKMVSAVL
jgi:radical SAM protein with 4Fe4S-binding SPASM domain